MRAAGLLRGPAPYDLSVLGADDAADARVGLGDADGALGQGQGFEQALRVQVREHHASLDALPRWPSAVWRITDRG